MTQPRRTDGSRSGHSAKPLTTRPYARLVRRLATHTKIESTVGTIGIGVDDALASAEQTDTWPTRAWDALDKMATRWP